MKIKIKTWDPKKKIMYGPFEFSHFPARLKRDCFVQRLYTDLKDKNGKEIYDGDIITIPDVNWMTESEWVIRYEPPGFIATRNDGQISLVFYGDLCEIIGNIHENPELLENGKGKKGK